MDRAWSQIAERFKVFFGSVAFVLGKSITGIVFLVGFHDAVPCHLGNNRGGGYGRRFPITLNDRLPFISSAGMRLPSIRA
jgi:hypothetical protein